MSLQNTLLWEDPTADPIDPIVETLFERSPNGRPTTQSIPSLFIYYRETDTHTIWQLYMSNNNEFNVVLRICTLYSNSHNNIEW